MATTPLMQEFPELSHLSRSNLDDLLTDPRYFESVLHSLSSVKALYRSQRELGMANEAIARGNLSLQDELFRLRSETKEAFDEAKALEARWKEVEREQKELYQRLTPQFLLLRLRHATTDQDNASEALATSFVQSSVSSDNTSDVDEFVRQFRELRKVYHKRAMWGDRWAAGQVIWQED